MQLFPKDIFERLEFSKILQLHKEYCLGSPAVSYFDNINPVADIKIVTRQLDDVSEWKRAIECSTEIPLGAYDPVHPFLPMLKKEGYILEVDQIQKIHRIVSLAQEVVKYFADPDRRNSNSNLFQIGSRININPALALEIDRVFDRNGEVKPDASDALLKISKSIRNKEREVDKVFNQELSLYKQRGYLVDTLESTRNGRRVLTVAVEHKRKIPGIIHDESATGKTVFIEPESCQQINNDIFNLYSERRSEIYRIVRQLCDFIRPYADEIGTAERLLVQLDIIRAKARVAIRLRANRPYILDKPVIALKNSRNPILYLKNSEIGEEVVPFDMELLGKNRVLVLSGPNAGGKSVTMKTVGLMQLMLQSGMLVCCDSNSKFGLFKKIMVDIGDQQSVEDDLSTYSSHLRNMNEMVRSADERTLILIDEFGSGTDPKFGGAIAEAVLAELNKKKVFGVITTHYSNLKFFAYKTIGLINGAMEFDKQRLTPTFQLKIGKPGSSFAYEIAQKSGLPESVINYARKKTGKNENAIDQMLIDLQSEKKEFEDKMAKLLDKEDKIDKMIKNYDQLFLELEIRRKKLKLEQKELQAAQTASRQKALETLLKELRNEKKLEKVEQLAKEEKVKVIALKQELVEIKEDVYRNTEKASKTLKVGDYARIRNTETVGLIERIDKNIASLQAGMFSLRIPIRELEYSNPPMEKKNFQSINYLAGGTGANVENKIDLRGYSKDDAVMMLQNFLDNAILSNHFQLKIIHGVGGGTLKKLVHQKLKEYKDITQIWHPDETEGGEGVTYVKI